jgi:hypothetical protein
MPTHATAEFEVTNWDESPTLQDNGGPKVTRASVTMDFHGDIEGKGSVEWLMGYDDAGETASFVGLERVVGSIGGRAGSFVVQHAGTFDGKLAKAKLEVVPGSGTGELEGLQGQGTLEAGFGEDGVRHLDLDYDL